MALAASVDMDTALEKSSVKRASLSPWAGLSAKAAWLSVPWLLAGVLSSVSCASSRTSASAPQAASNSCPNASASGCSAAASSANTEGGMMGADCPMKVPGTSMREVDVDGGAALEFSTTGDVSEVQRRVARMAEMHNHRGGGMMNAEMTDGGAMQEHCMMGGGMRDGGMMQGHGMMGGGMMGGGMMGIQADARVEDTPQGARLIFTPKDPKDLDALRRHTKEHAGQGCPMMSMHQ